MEAKRASGSPEAGVTGDCELPDAGAGNWTQVLGMSLSELTTESSLQPQHLSSQRRHLWPTRFCDSSANLKQDEW